jgi:hypothetical protein
VNEGGQAPPWHALGRPERTLSDTRAQKTIPGNCFLAAIGPVLQSEALGWEEVGVGPCEAPVTGPEEQTGLGGKPGAATEEVCSQHLKSESGNRDIGLLSGSHPPKATGVLAAETQKGARGAELGNH